MSKDTITCEGRFGKLPGMDSVQPQPWQHFALSRQISLRRVPLRLLPFTLHLRVRGTGIRPTSWADHVCVPRTFFVLNHESDETTFGGRRELKIAGRREKQSQSQSNVSRREEVITRVRGTGPSDPHFVRYYPAEALSEPIFRTWHFFCRVSHG